MVGWLPGITLCGTTAAADALGLDLLGVRPKASALVWAKKLDMNRSCMSPMSWLGSLNPMKSAGISLVPWWISW